MAIDKNHACFILNEYFYLFILYMCGGVYQAICVEVKGQLSPLRVSSENKRSQVLKRGGKVPRC